MSIFSAEKCARKKLKANFGNIFSCLFAHKPRSKYFRSSAHLLLPFISGEESLVDDNRRLEVKTLKKDIDELIYEWVDVDEGDVNDDDDDDDTSNVDADYCKALHLAVRRYDLMERLGFKAVSLLDGLSTCVEIARDTKDFVAVKKYGKKGREKASMLYGHSSQEVKEWDSILINCEN